MAEILFVVLVTFVLFFTLKFLISLAKNKKLPPGPIGIPILGHLHLLGDNPHQDLCRLARKHGPVMFVRFGMVPTVVVSSPGGAEQVLKTNDLAFANRPHVGATKYFAPDFQGIVFGQYGPYWRNMRKICVVELLTQLKINQFSVVRKAELGLLIQSVKESAKMRETVDVSARVADLTADVICLIVFGKKFENKTLDGMGFKDVANEVIDLFSRLFVGDCLPFISVFDFQGLARRLKVLGKIVDGFSDKIIEDHNQEVKKSQNDRQDFVDTMLAMMKDPGDTGFQLGVREIKDLITDLYIAGSDTTATMIEWTLSELLRHPTAMKKLQKELEVVVGMDTVVEESHLERLEYLDCVVKETFRLHPALPFLIPRESMQDCLLDGFHVPKGTRILVNTWTIGRDPELWADPESFSPERFIGNDIDVRGQHFNLLPFGSGRRGCPGSQLGLVMIRVVVAQLVHCFDWELPNGMLPMELDMSEKFGLVTSRVKHLMAIPTYRLRK